MMRIVTFVEGEGESEAVPILIGRLISEMNAWDAVQVDEHPFRVGNLGKLLKGNCKEWLRLIGACLKRPNVGGVLLMLDGDVKTADGEPFCAVKIARKLAAVARQAGAGSKFSVAVVFACLEYESWLLASSVAFADKVLPDGRRIPLSFRPPDGDLEEAPRDAKGWLNQRIQGGYKPTRDQATLTKWLDLNHVRARQLRSFRRLESAMNQLVDAFRHERHISSPE